MELHILTHDEIRKMIVELEQKYGMASEDFYERFCFGELGDARDFIMWATFYEIEVYG